MYPGNIILPATEQGVSAPAQEQDRELFQSVDGYSYEVGCQHQKAVLRCAETEKMGLSLCRSEEVVIMGGESMDIGVRWGGSPKLVTL